MSTPNFLPEGFEFEDIEMEPIPVPIITADDDGPTFTVLVNALPIKEYRSIFSRITRQDTTGGARQTQANQDRTDRDYLVKVVAGWTGLTIANWNALVRDKRVLKGPKNGEISHTDELSFYIYRNTWPQDYGNKIFEVVQAGAAAAEETEEALKKG